MHRPIRVSHEVGFIDILDTTKDGILGSHKRNRVEDVRHILHGLTGDELLAELYDEGHGGQDEGFVAGADDEIEEVEGEGERERIGEEIDKPFVHGR